MNEIKKKIGIYGGGFDPVHVAHLILAQYAIEGLGLDRVLFVPSGGHPCYKDEQPANGADRVEMLRLALAPHPQLEVSTYEVDQNEFCYTIDTLRHFRETMPDCEIVLLVGGDWRENIHTWKEGEQLLKEFSIAYFPRPGSEPESEKRNGATAYTFTMPLIDISSTMIRERVRQGLPIRYLVPEPVSQYIEAKGLYRGVKSDK